MPSIATDPDLLAPAAVHSIHVSTNERVRMACGYTWERGSEPKPQWTGQWDDVTCDDCVETLRAAGIAAGVRRR